MDILLFFKTLYQNRYFVGVTGLLLFVFSFYVYHVHATAKIESLELKNQELTKLVVEQKTKLDSLTANYNAIIQAKDELLTEVRNLKEQQRVEEEKIYRENRKKKSLEKLAVKKSKLVQDAVNKATKNAFDCFVILSQGGDC